MRDKFGKFIKGNIPWSKENKELMYSNRKGKSYEEIYGEEKSKNIREKIAKKLNGRIAWNKGKKTTEETKEKIRKSLLGRKLSEEIKRKISLSNKGKRASEETRKKISESKKGIKLSEEHKKKLKESHKGMLGKHLSEDHKEKIRRNHSHYWKGKKFSEEAKRKKSLSIKENSKTNTNFGMRGKHHSEQTKIKIRLGNKGKIVSKEFKNKMRLIKIKYIQNCLNNGEPIFPTIGKNETKILNQIEELLKLRIIRQYFIKNLGYWVDGYIPELNLIIEIDEKYHLNSDGRLKERDVVRQKIIENELKCTFIRIKDIN